MTDELRGVLALALFAAIFVPFVVVAFRVTGRIDRAQRRWFDAKLADIRARRSRP